MRNAEDFVLQMSVITDEKTQRRQEEDHKDRQFCPEFARFLQRLLQRVETFVVGHSNKGDNQNLTQQAAVLTGVLRRLHWTCLRWVALFTLLMRAVNCVC